MTPAVAAAPPLPPARAVVVDARAAADDGGDSRPSSSAAPLERHVVHASLTRPVLFAGAEPPAVVVEVTTAFALVFGVGLHVATVLLAAFYLTAVHAVMVWVAAQDPRMTALYVRSLSARDYYPARSSVHAAPPPVRPSIPPRGA